MPQDRESGAAGRAYGLRIGKIVAHLLGAEKLAASSNEVRWQGRRAVIKACAPLTTSFGVTTTMLSRLDSILVVVERMDGTLIVHELDAMRFRTEMRDSRSASAVGGRVKLVSSRVAETDGERIARFTTADIAAAEDVLATK